MEILLKKEEILQKLSNYMNLLEIEANSSVNSEELKVGYEQELKEVEDLIEIIQ